VTGRTAPLEAALRRDIVPIWMPLCLVLFLLPLLARCAPPTAPSTVVPMGGSDCPRGGDDVWQVIYAPDGKTLAAVTWGIHLYSAETLAPRQCFEHQHAVSVAAYAPDGQTIAVALANFAVQLWQADDGTPLRSFEGHSSYVRGIAFSPDGQILATASDDKTVRLWQVADGNLLHVLEHEYIVWDVAFSPDGHLVATGDGGALLWQVRGGTMVGRIEAQRGIIASLAFSPDGQILAIGDDTVRLFSVEDGRAELLHVLEDDKLGKLDIVRSIAISPDGRLVAAAGVVWRGESDEYIVGLWQVEDGEFLARLVGAHDTEVSSVAFSPDGSTLASGWQDGIRLLEVKQVMSSEEP